MRSVFPDQPRASEALADHAEEARESPTNEHDSENGDDCNKTENKCVFRETLPFLAAKDQRHDASFLKRRLAFVATRVGPVQDATGPGNPTVASA